MTKVHRGTVLRPEGAKCGVAILCAFFLKRNNMKKTYLKPAWQVIELKQQGCLLAGSGKQVGGLGGSAKDLFNFDDDDIEDTGVDR